MTPILPAPLPGTVYIYALKCPDTLELRYVGKTCNLRKRLWQHIYEAKQKTNKNHRIQWIRGLLNRGGEPVLEVLEAASITNWQERERFFIKFYRDLGSLVNMADGGEGFTSESAAKLWTRPGHRENYVAKRKGIPCPDDVKNKISACLKGRKQSEEQSLKKQGKKHATEHCSRISAGLKAAYANGDRTPARNKRCRKINRFTVNGELVDSFDSFRGLCRQLNWSGSTVQRALKDGKERGITKGYVLKYAD